MRMQTWVLVLIAVLAVIAPTLPSHAREDTSSLSFLVQKSLARVDATWRKLQEQNSALRQEGAALEREKQEAARALKVAETKAGPGTDRAVRFAVARVVETTANVVAQRERARLLAHKALLETRVEIDKLVERLRQHQGSGELGATLPVGEYLTRFHDVGENLETILVSTAGDVEETLPLVLLRNRFDSLSEERTEVGPSGLQTRLREGLEHHKRILDDLLTLSTVLGQSNNRQKQMLAAGAQLGLASLNEESITGSTLNAVNQARHFKQELDKVRVTDEEIKNLLERHISPRKQPPNREASRAALGSLTGPNGRLF